MGEAETSLHQDSFDDLETETLLEFAVFGSQLSVETQK